MALDESYQYPMQYNSHMSAEHTGYVLYRALVVTVPAVMPTDIVLWLVNHSLVKFHKDGGHAITTSEQ